MSVSRFALPFTLAATMAVSACSSKTEKTAVEPTPTPAEAAIIKSALTQAAAMANVDGEAKLNSVKMNSLDGEGRIFLNADRDAVTIYTKPATMVPLDIKSAASENAVQRTYKKFLNDYYSPRTTADITSENMVKFTQYNFYADEGAKINKGGKDGARSIYNIHAGRVCTFAHKDDKEDCVNIADLSPNTQLAKDIRIAQKGIAVGGPIGPSF